MSRIYATSGDAGRVISTTLKDDDVARDLSGASSIECHQRDGSDGSVTVITGLSGTVDGAVETTLGTLDAGTYSLEWEVTEGSNITTYPADADDRPILIVRTEAD